MIQTEVNPALGYKTERRSKRQQVRDRNIEILKLTFNQLSDGRWVCKTSRLKIPYDTYTAICLAQLQGEIRAKGHTWQM